MSDVVVLASVTHKTRRCIEHVVWRPSVGSVYPVFFSELNRARGAYLTGTACDAASIHFGPTVRRTNDPTYVLCTAYKCCSKVCDNSSAFANDLVVCRKRIEPDFEGYQAPPDKAPHFVFPLRDRFIQEGIGFKLLASVEGKPPPTVGLLLLWLYLL